MLRRNLLAFLFVCGAAAAGCHRGQPPLPPPRPPEVRVAPAVRREVTDYEEFTGRTEAVETVEVRARVSGYLDRVHFKEGAVVRKGALLFEIDPRPLAADLERAEANLSQAESRRKRLESDYERGRRLLPGGAIGREEFDRIAGDLAEATSAVKSARAARNISRLNLEYSRVTAPTTGRISRRWVDPGNMVKADETALTLIVSLDPMYATFDIDERTFLAVQRFLEREEVSPGLRQRVPVLMGLADEEGFPHAGEVNFVDNRVDPNTGSVWVRGVFRNRRNLLTPGLFVRVRLPLGAPHPAVLIPERALGTDQGQKFVYVLDAEDKAVYTRVQVGEQHDQFRAVKEGVRPGQRVIVSGLQRVRAGARVKPVEEKPDAGKAKDGAGQQPAP